MISSRQSTEAKPDMSSLNIGHNYVEVESKSLIQKAHELYNVQLQRTPEKALSLAERAARINNEIAHELPAIEEAFEKENDTFAQGGPLAAL